MRVLLVSKTLCQTKLPVSLAADLLILITLKVLHDYLKPRPGWIQFPETEQFSFSNDEFSLMLIFVKTKERCLKNQNLSGVCPVMPRNLTKSVTDTAVVAVLTMGWKFPLAWVPSTRAWSTMKVTCFSVSLAKAKAVTQP